jgi:hypothetical protein
MSNLRSLCVTACCLIRAISSKMENTMLEPIFGEKLLLLGKIIA